MGLVHFLCMGVSVSAIYEFERGERVLIFCGHRPEPALMFRPGRIWCTVLACSPHGLPVPKRVRAQDIGLRYEYMAFDAVAEEQLEKMP